MDALPFAKTPADRLTATPCSRERPGHQEL